MGLGVRYRIFYRPFRGQNWNPKTVLWRFLFNKNSGLKFRKFHVPNGWYIPVAQTRLRVWFLFLYAGYKRAVQRTTILSNEKGHFGPSDQPTEMTRPVKVDHLQSWSWIFRSDQTEMVRSIWCTNGNFRNFGLMESARSLSKQNWTIIFEIQLMRRQVCSIAWHIPFKETRYCGTTPSPFLKNRRHLRLSLDYITGFVQILGSKIQDFFHTTQEQSFSSWCTGNVRMKLNKIYKAGLS